MSVKKALNSAGAISVAVIGLAAQALTASGNNPTGTDCSDPNYSYLPVCDAPGNPSFMSKQDYEKFLQLRDAVQCNKAKMACQRLRDAKQRAACLANVAEIC